MRHFSPLPLCFFHSPFAPHFAHTKTNNSKERRKKKGKWHWIEGKMWNKSKNRTIKYKSLNTPYNMENRHITTAMCDRPNYLHFGHAYEKWVCKTFHKTREREREKHTFVFFSQILIYDLWSCNETICQCQRFGKKREPQPQQNESQVSYAHKINQEICGQLFWNNTSFKKCRKRNEKRTFCCCFLLVFKIDKMFHSKWWLRNVRFFFG